MLDRTFLLLVLLFWFVSFGQVILVWIHRHTCLFVALALAHYICETCSSGYLGLRGRWIALHVVFPSPRQGITKHGEM